MTGCEARHPGVEIESCSGGGGRVDLGMLERVDQVWTSDNTEAFDRLRIQEGFTMAYTPKVMMAWVTDVPNMNGRVTPLRYRFLTAMQGSLGIGGNLSHWSEADNKLAAEMIAYYKRVRQSVQEGRLYRLLSPRRADAAVNEYVARDGRQASSSRLGTRSSTCAPCRPSGCGASSRRPSTASSGSTTDWSTSSRPSPARP